MRQDYMVGLGTMNDVCIKFEQKLIKSIKEDLLNYQEARYEISIIVDSMLILNAKPKDNKYLHEYTRRFKSCKDAMESQIGGPIILKIYENYA